MGGMSVIQKTEAHPGQRSTRVARERAASACAGRSICIHVCREGVVWRFSFQSQPVGMGWSLSTQFGRHYSAHTLLPDFCIIALWAPRHGCLEVGTVHVKPGLGREESLSIKALLQASPPCTIEAFTADIQQLRPPQNWLPFWVLP